MATLMVGDKFESERWGRNKGEKPRHTWAENDGVYDVITGRKLSMKQFTKLLHPHVIPFHDEDK